MWRRRFVVKRNNMAIHIGFINAEGDAGLAHLRETNGFFRLVPRPAQGGQEDRHEQGNDRHHDQQFNQRETSSVCSSIHIVLLLEMRSQVMDNSKQADKGHKTCA